MHSIRPVWLGIGLALGYLSAHWLFDGLVLLVWGFPDAVQPAWRNDLWWTDLINAAILGYLPAAVLNLRRGIVHDLETLRPHLDCGDNEFARIRDDVSGPGGRFARSLSFGGVLLGVAIVYLDPSISLFSEASLSNPQFVWALVRTALLVAFVSTLVVADFRATRCYAKLSHDWVMVDLLDIRSLAPFARRGQRSVLTWAVFATIFSLFWLGDTAASVNLPLLVGVIGLATAAYFVPLLGLRKTIRAAKQVELDRLRGAIRIEGASLRGPAAANTEQSPRLANLVSYYQLIESTREWPIDATSLVRLSFYIAIGLGSWLGAAIVERLLDGMLGG